MQNNYDLQLFAEGTAADGSGESSTSTPGEGVVNTTSVGNVDPGNNKTEVNTETPKKSLKELIGSDDEYNKEFTKMVEKRTRKSTAQTKQLEQQNSQMQKIIEMANLKYGLDTKSSSFYDDLYASISKDTSFYEEEAAAQGMNVEDYLKVKQAERVLAQNAEREQQEESDRQFNEAFSSVIEKAKETAQKYPSFDFNAEMQNEQFFRLVAPWNVGGSGVDPTLAYEMVHPEIKENLMKAVAQQSAVNTANAMQANISRPTENGVTNSAAANTKVDVSKFTLKDFEKHREMFLKTGERFKF